MVTPYKDAVLGTAGLVSLWGLDEASGNALDSKGANPGEPKGGLTRAQASLLPNGEGASTSFNGTTGYFKVPNSASLEIADTVSFEAWGQLSALGANRYIIDLGTNSGQMNVESTDRLQIGKAGASAVAESSSTVDTNSHHFVVTKTGATRAVYIDGVDVTGLFGDFTFVKSSEAKAIGAWHAGTLAFFSGRLQYVAVYNAALSKATVEAHYAAGFIKIVEATASGSGTGSGTASGTVVKPAVNGTASGFGLGTGTATGTRTRFGAATGTGAGTGIASATVIEVARPPGTYIFIENHWVAV